MFKKAQSALEFLTTYGWAFLVILIMIGALAYFGVLDPSRFLPDKCVATTGFSCGETTAEVADPGVVRAMLTNGGAKDITLASIAAGDAPITGSAACGATAAAQLGTTDWLAGDVTWRAGETMELVLTCTGAIADGERVDVRIDSTYLPAGGQYDKAFDLTMSVRAN
jgi:hypothetical protein